MNDITVYLQWVLDTELCVLTQMTG